MDSLVKLKVIKEDKVTLNTLFISVTLCLLGLMYNFIFGLFLIILFVISLSFASYIVQSSFLQKQFQDFLLTVLKSERKIKSANNVERNDVKFYVARDLDKAFETFLNKLLNQFISSWYTNVSDDKSFLCNIKREISSAARNLAIRCQDIDYPMLITTKLLPVVYTHFSEIKHSIKAADSIKQYIADNNQIHPATVNRKSEIKYLRSLSESIIPYLFSTNNLNCKSSFTIVRELFTNWIFLPITDIISEPDILNMLVILATNSKTNSIRELKDMTEVELLENFSKSIENDGNNCEQRVDGNFFNDQEKLYNFMQFLKTKNCKDVEILKFVLDVEHMNAELEKQSVISDPIKLSNLQKMSEKLLLLYRDNLFNGSDLDRPKDLILCYNHARKYLEHRWKYDFYKSAEYYKYIYGDREQHNKFKLENEDISSSGPSSDISNQKLTARIKSAMSMKIAVDGIEEGDIQIFDALDVVNPVSPFNSMAVRLRKEKGQDLDNFMKTLFHSIEQEADIGEDIVLTQTKLEKNRSKIKFGNIELYQNLFNITGQSSLTHITISSFIKTPTQSLLYFLTEIVRFNDIILRIITGFLNFLPNSDVLICLAIRKSTEKLINQAIVAHLVKELEEKIFDQKPKQTPTQQELIDRKNLAMERLDKIKDGLSNNLVLLQNPVFNKHLAYCLLDTIIIEAFTELDPNNMPK